jgi:argininosuccinate synthase
MSQFDILLANSKHYHYSSAICDLIQESSKVRGTGIAGRTPQQISQKMQENKAIIALSGGQLAGFCYFETWDDNQFVSNSALIIHPQFRYKNLARLIKEFAFTTARNRYPDAILFGLTTSFPVMKINSELGFQPTVFSQLPKDQLFWKGCNSCVNFDILSRTQKQHCLCVGMTFNPKKEQQSISNIKQSSTMKVVLAFSGGLDTSFCVPYLKQEKGLEVYTATVNTGGFDQTALKRIETHAYQIGSQKHSTLEATSIYYQQCIKYLIWGNILRYNTYPLSVSSERFFQAMALVDYAKKIGAEYIAHGSTGAGNDQVRFDLAIQILAPEIKIIAPIRSMQLSRQQEIDYLKKQGISMDWEKAAYSINKGLWGTTIGGKETLTSHQSLPESAYPSPLSKTAPETLYLQFEKGELVGVNEQSFASSVEAIQMVEKIASAFAIGRDTHVGDTIIGLKGRIGFVAAAPIVIVKSHELLEKHCLTKWQIYWKEQLANWYGMLLHEGQYLDPVMRSIEAFIEKTQETISGRVQIKLHPYRFELVGIESNHDLMQAKFGQYGETNQLWSSEDAVGFIKLLSNPIKFYHQVNTSKEISDEQ